MDLKFNDVEQLYDLLLPALETKEIQLRRNDYLGLSKKDIWDYLKDTKWKDYKEFRVHQMISDILTADNDSINSYKEM